MGTADLPGPRCTPSTTTTTPSQSAGLGKEGEQTGVAVLWVGLPLAGRAECAGALPACLPAHLPPSLLHGCFRTVE